MNRAAFAALAILIFVIPWENTVAFSGLGSIARLAAAFATLLGVVSVVASGTLRRPHVFHVLAVGFLLWSAMSILWAINSATSLTRTTTYLLVVIMAWLIWQFARTESRQLTLLQAYVFGAYVPALDTLKNYIAGTSVRTMRFAATGFNPNEIAMILVLAIPIAWYLHLSLRKGPLPLVNACYIPVAMLAVLLTASRGAFISALMALLLVPWSLQRLSVRARVGMVGLLVASMIVIGSMVPPEIWARIGETAGKIEEGDLSDRQLLWEAAVGVFAEYPVAGVGAGGFEHAAQPLEGREVPPHNTFLSVLVGQGLVGLTLFLGMFAAAFRPIPRMPGLQRKFWIVLALTLLIGLLPRSWDYRKPTWFILGILIAQSALVRHREAPLAAAGKLAVREDALSLQAR